jgi:hypothetical protein
LVRLIEDPKWELAILATVQGFYQKLLQGPVGADVPVPAGLETHSLQSEQDVAATLERMRSWLRLLDMAITPAMLRQALTAETDAEIAEALLRYLARKKDASDCNRDKTDLVATFLYRHPRVPGQWDRRGYGLDGALPLSPFEIALIEILADTDVPSLPEEHVQLLRRFAPLQEEALAFHDLNALLDSEIISRVRELKQSLELSFFHPGVLATIAPYNTAFGSKFDELFRIAVKEIKHFSSALEEQGGSILGTVDGVDVTIEHISALEDNELLKIDYATALQKFVRVSKLKKVLDKRPPIRVTRTIPFPVPKKRAENAVQRSVQRLDIQALCSSVTPQQISTEESRLQNVEESIRVFVRVANPRMRQVVPMRFFNLTLTSAEADAFSADYLGENSLRAKIAQTLMRSVALIARMITASEEAKRAENSESLWRLHADSLIVLLNVERNFGEQTAQVLEDVRQSNSAADLQNLELSLQKLRDRRDVAISVLTSKHALQPA